MDILKLVFIVLSLMTISIIAMHVWVGMWDVVIALLKKVLHIGNKKKTPWHTIEGGRKDIAKQQIHAKKVRIDENENENTY